MDYSISPSLIESDAYIQRQELGKKGELIGKSIILGYIVLSVIFFVYALSTFGA